MSNTTQTPEKPIGEALSALARIISTIKVEAPHLASVDYMYLLRRVNEMWAEALNAERAAILAAAHAERAAAHAAEESDTPPV